MLPVSYLFVPGNRPDRFDKAVASGAGAIILDLEDAVAPHDKAAARQAIADWIATSGVDSKQVVVRINDAASPWYADDLALVKSSGIAHIMLPKTEFAGQVAMTIAGTHPALAVIALVESARGISNIDQIALAEGVQRIAFGTLDYAADLQITGHEWGYIYPYSRIAIASRSAELAAPIAGVTATLDDLAQTEADFVFARALGCTAKLCIHPKQVEVIERLSAPSEDEVMWAEKILRAARESSGATQVDGRMVDRPVVLKAEAIQARRLRARHGGHAM